MAVWAEDYHGYVAGGAYLVRVEVFVDGGECRPQPMPLHLCGVPGPQPCCCGFQMNEGAKVGASERESRGGCVDCPRQPFMVPTHGGGPL